VEVPEGVVITWIFGASGVAAPVAISSIRRIVLPSFVMVLLVAL
jgi:hypothetical protein